MTIKERFFRVTHILFAVLLLVQLLPDRSAKETCASSLIIFAIAAEAVVILLSFIIKKKESLSLTLDIFGFIYVLLTAWTLATAKFALLTDQYELLFPAPGKVIAQFAEDREVIITNIKSSLGITVQGFLLAAVVAVPLRLLLGSNARVGNSATYLTKFFSSIPPIVYIPYGIALLPTFRSVSVFVIFLASFFPIFSGTMSGVLGVDKKIVDSARVLNVKKPAMLTSAEMIGARDGMGYYVKYYSDFGDYTRTITGLLVIGIVVIEVTFLFNRLQQYLLRWKR